MTESQKRKEKRKKRQQLVEKGREMEQVVRDRSNLEEDLVKARRLTEEAQLDRDRLRSQLEGQNTELRRTNLKLTETVGQLELKVRELELLKPVIDGLRSTLEARNRHIANLEKDNPDVLRKRLREKTEEINRLKGELAEARKTKPEPDGKVNARFDMRYAQGGK